MNYYDMILLGQLNFYLEMLIPMFLLMRRQTRRKRFALRLLLLVAVGAGLVFLPTINVGPFGLHYIIICVIVLAEGKFLYRCSWLNILFYVVTAFAIQHLMWDFLFIIYESIGVLSQAAAIVIYIGLYLAIYLLMYFFMPVANYDSNSIKRRWPQLVVSLLIMVFVYILASLVPVYASWDILYRLYAMVCCVFSIILQCGFSAHFKIEEDNSLLEQDNIILQELLLREQKYYAATRKAIELINVKSHDLKHQIAALREMDSEERNKTLDEMEKAATFYKKISNTGNKTLDVILTEKNFMCEAYGIRFTCMTENADLSFMEIADIASLFGNAVDNAIASARKESDPEKRLIMMNISEKRGHLVIHIENTCTENIRFNKDGLPISSNPDRENHGFGAKSMKFIAEKYGGIMSFGHDGKMFSLDIVFPLNRK